METYIGCFIICSIIVWSLAAIILGMEKDEDLENYKKAKGNAGI